VLVAVLAEPEEIDISRGSMRLIFPQGEEHGSLQSELTGIRRLRQPVEQTLVCESDEQKVEILIIASRQALETIHD
jgi:hypothetical protein